MQTDVVWVFDLDDTLYAEFDYMISGYRHVSALIENLYGCQVSDELMLQWWHENRATVFQRIVELVDGPPDLLQALVWAYRNHRPDIELYPDAAELIGKLQNKQPYYIITDGRSLTQRLKISQLGLRPEFSFISEEVGAGKPHTPAFDLIQEKHLGSRIHYFADNLGKDFLRPNELGWITHGMRDRGRNIHVQDVIEHVSAFQPSVWLDDFSVTP